jgi:ABC-2 type transport system ATP-binding protein
VRFHVDTVHLAAAVRCLTDAGLRTLVSNPPTLEEMFLRHYGDELADDLRSDDLRSHGGPEAP